MVNDIRVRIAPSPTGKLHFGTARVALFNYLFAKKNNGKFVLRIEDTDPERSQEIYTEDIIKAIDWLGLVWDEGPEKGGDFGPYFQQERYHIYEEYTDQLLESGKAYKCFCTIEEIEAEREAAKEKNLPYRYSGKCKNLSNVELTENEAAGKPFAIRLSTESQVVSFKDLIHGQMEYNSDDFGDFVIVRSDGTPIFIYTNVIDDYLMKISHVLRGDDHLTNTGKQLLIYQALEFDIPEFGHFPQILNADRSKMSKRKNPTSITEDFKDKGYLPEAIVNFMVLLGWSSGTDREIFTLQELVNSFSLERVSKAPAIFDPDKLLYFNGYYIRQFPIEELAKRCEPFIKNEKILKALKDDLQFFYKVLKLVQERMKRLDEVDELTELFFVKPEYDTALLVAKKSTEDKAVIALNAVYETVSNLDLLDKENTEPLLRETAGQNDLKDGELLWSLRVALSGKDASPGAFELLEVLEKEESLKRIKSALEKLDS